MGELPFSLQAKILRLVQSREYRMIGGDRDRVAEIRIVAATNRDLSVEVTAKRFREDLFWRLAVVTIRIPGLRDRVEDIESLALHFISRHSVMLGKTVLGLDAVALEKLRAHSWPGNVRELENVIERAVLLGGADRIQAGDIEFQKFGQASSSLRAEQSATPTAARAFDDVIRKEVGDVTRTELIKLLEAHDWNVADAATSARRNRTAFYSLLKRYGIDPRRDRQGAAE